MKFFWELNNKGKFIRVFWMGLIALLILYVVCWFVVDDVEIKMVIPIVSTIIYIFDLILRYKRVKPMKGQS